MLYMPQQWRHVKSLVQFPVLHVSKHIAVVKVVSMTFLTTTWPSHIYGWSNLTLADWWQTVVNIHSNMLERCKTNKQKKYTAAREVLHKNYRSRNHIDPYHFLVLEISPTSFTRPFLGRRHAHVGCETQFNSHWLLAFFFFFSPVTPNAPFFVPHACYSGKGWSVEAE